MSKDNAIAIFKSSRQVFLEKWIEYSRSHPHFKSHDFFKTPEFELYAKGFLNALLSAFESHEVPSFPDESMGPLFRFWEQLKSEQAEQGLSPRESALLIFSFKQSLSEILEGMPHTDTEASAFRKILNVLDFLGLLTVEDFAKQQSELENQQAAQILHFQSKEHEKLFSDLVGQSPAMVEVYKAIGLILENDMTVLLQGESGTGKDYLAQLIHHHSNRRSGPYVAINCAAIPKELIESELFGHEKGAFTGAVEQKIGKFELAKNGTLFLDEIGDLALDLQVKLLRVLQNKEIERVGGSQKIQVNPRIIAATHQDLERAVEQKKFRLDLYYRLNVFPIRVPSLRERVADIVPLAEHFIEKYASEYAVPVASLDSSAKSDLKSQDWPGNIRELENLIQRSVVLSAGQTISAEILQYRPGHVKKVLLDTPKPTNPNGIQSLAELEKAGIAQALEKTGWNILKTAEALGVSRTTLYNKMKEYKLSKSD